MNVVKLLGDSSLITKSGDTRQTYELALLNKNLMPINLSSSTINLLLADEQNVVIRKSVTVTDAAQGKISFKIESTEQLPVGLFDMEFQVTYPDNTIEIFPRDGYLKLKVLGNLNDKGDTIQNRDTLSQILATVEQRAQYAKEQGDYAKAQADRLLGVDSNGTVTGIDAAAVDDRIKVYHAVESVRLLDFVNLVTSKPTLSDPSTWDWTPAIQGAINSITSKVVSQQNYNGIVTNLIFPSGYYKHTGIVSRPYIQMVSSGIVTLAYFGNPTLPAVKIGMVSGEPYLYKGAYARGTMINGSKGTFFIKNLNELKGAGSIGLQIGNEAAGLRETARYHASDITMTGFEYGLLLVTQDNYLGAFDRLHFEENKYNVVWGKTAGIASNNSGENFRFNDCGFAGGDAAFLLNADTSDFTFKGCSFDFNNYIGLLRCPHGYTNIKITDCYAENNYKELFRNETDVAAAGFYQKPNIFINQFSQLLKPDTHTLFSGHMNVYVNGYEQRIPDPITDATKLFMFNTTGEISVRDNISNTGYTMIESPTDNVNPNSYNSLATGTDALSGGVPFMQIGKYDNVNENMQSITVSEDVLFLGKKTLKFSTSLANNRVQFGAPQAYMLKAREGDKFSAKIIGALNSTTNVGFQWQFIAWDANGVQLTTRTEQAWWSMGLTADTTKKLQVVGTTKTITCPPNTAYVDVYVLVSGITGDFYLADFFIQNLNASGSKTGAMVTTTTTPTPPATDPVVTGVLATDNFDRADSTTGLGTAVTGQNWSSHAGTWGISGNKAYTVVDWSVTCLNVTGSANSKVSADISVNASNDNGGIVARLSDPSNFFLFNFQSTDQKLYLYKYVGGSATSLQSVPLTLASGTTHNFAVVAYGSQIKCYVDGVLYITVNDTFNATNTWQGFRQTSSTMQYFDNFKVESLTA